MWQPGLRREMETSSQGAYVLPDLETGIFTVEIAKEGFAPVRFSNVKLEVGQPRTLDVVLGVAERKERISVTEAEFQLDRVDATAGAPIETFRSPIRSVDTHSTTCLSLDFRTLLIHCCALNERGAVPGLWCRLLAGGRRQQHF
jgi:hypothetical protein